MISAFTMLSCKTFPTLFVVVLLSICIFVCHYYYLQSLAERDKHFSHLSSLERELSFRSEMAMYYSYFKDLISAPNLIEGLGRITSDSMIQYPDTVNALQRFNVYPEVFTAVLYRIYVKICQFLNAPLMECWQVERGGEMPPVTSCEGFGEPAYFYTNFVFFINGFLPVFVFLFGYFLSNSSIFGGIVAASSFFFNHRECTRVMWTPPLRESFAFPFIILQNLLVEICLRKDCRQNFFLISGLVFCNFILLLSWQFSQFAFLTQLFALSFLYGANYFDADFSPLNRVLCSHFISLAISSIFLFGNRFLLTSLYAAALLNFVFLLLGHARTRSLRFPVVFLFRCSLMLAGTFTMRRVLISLVGGVEDDSHILDLLKTKLLPSFRTFHTQLYVCAPEFDFLGYNAVYAISATLLLPVVSFLAIRFLISIRRQPQHLVYHFLQLGAYAVMALFIMRLKLFFTPFLCITASLIIDEEGFLPSKINTKKTKTILVALVFGSMVLLGAQNLRSEWAVSNEFANWPLESLVNWIDANTKPRDAFAGAMPTTSAIRLSAMRPIANHPHYEDVSMRNRTLAVYTIYSRKPLSQIHSVFRKLSIPYVVVEAIWCESHRHRCALAELYDIVDVENRANEPACYRMMDGRAEPYFKLVFKKDPYYLLKVLP